MDQVLNRRDLLRLLGVSGLALQLPAADPGAPLFFTREEFALLDALTELVIPADDHSPGARDAHVAGYIDQTVAESFLPEDKTSWRKGLRAINDLSQQLYGASFLAANKQQQTALLERIAHAEKNPQTEPEKFFTQLKQTSAFAYYSSSIGIHQEMEYRGNTMLREFVGYEVT